MARMTHAFSSYLSLKHEPKQIVRNMWKLGEDPQHGECWLPAQNFREDHLVPLPIGTRTVSEPTRFAKWPIRLDECILDRTIVSMYEGKFLVCGWGLPPFFLKFASANTEGSENKASIICARPKDLHFNIIPTQNHKQSTKLRYPQLPWWDNSGMQ